MEHPKHPDVKVRLTTGGIRGGIITEVAQALRHAGYGSEVGDYLREATRDGCLHPADIAAKWVTVVPHGEGAR